VILQKVSIKDAWSNTPLYWLFNRSVSTVCMFTGARLSVGDSRLRTLFCGMSIPTFDFGWGTIPRLRWTSLQRSPDNLAGGKGCPLS